jgi:hypothetical protein
MKVRLLHLIEAAQSSAMRESGRTERREDHADGDEVGIMLLGVCDNESKATRS